MNKDNQQENTMRERLVCMPWYMKTAIELADFIEKETALARKEAIEECIKLSDKIELREPDGGTKQWMAFKAFRNTMIDRLQALSDIKDK